MKRIWTVVFILFCVASFSAAAKEKDSGAAIVDMSKMHRIFIGWSVVDANYHKLGYGTQQDWDVVVRSANAHFFEMCKSSALGTGREVVGAKSPDDTNVKDYDLYIKPVDVSFDYGYRLHIGFDLVDAKTGANLLHMDAKRYGAHFCALTGCMNKEFDDAAEDINARLGLHK